MKISIQDLLQWLDSRHYTYVFEGDAKREITGFSSIAEYREDTISWVQKEELYESAGRPEDIACAIVQGNIKVGFQNVVRTEFSKEIFFAILENFWGKRKKEGNIGSGTVAEPGASIDSSVSIGCNCTISAEVCIRAHTVIEHNVVLQGKVVIGENCYIQSGAVIGIDGFGYSTNPETGKKVMVKHFGGVRIGNDVFIGSHVNIARGTIDDTVIGDGVKIAPSTHIGHNSRMEDDVTVICSQLYGSTKIGRGSYITASTVQNQITVGRHSVIGMGSVVTKSIGDNMIAYGIPARAVRNNDSSL